MDVAADRPRGRVICAVAGLSLAALAGVRLALVLPRVANRYAFGWDSARRAMLDLDAAEALRQLDLRSFFWYVGGPETWPTLRLVLAAPLQVLAGAGGIFAVEHGLSIAATAAIAVALALAARAVASSAMDALLVFAVGAAHLAGNRALLVYAADGMLEPLSALLTLAATGAWIAARRRGTARPWSLALLGNLLFHVKWQHGIFFAGTVLAFEGMSAGTAPARRSVAAVLRSLLLGARSWAGSVLLALAALLATIALAVSATGGIEGTYLGARVALRDVHGPIAWLALALFTFVQLALWRDRSRLAGEVPQRLRFLWTWLATPMAAWILVPFTWRLRTLMVTAGGYDSGDTPVGSVRRLLYYPGSAWETWVAPGARPLLLVMLVASALAAWRVPAVRRWLAPIATLAAMEWLALSLVSRHNYQARFALNLAPLLALAGAAWIVAVPATWLRALLAVGATIALAAAASPGWRTETLAATMGQGFNPAEHGDACRRMAEAVAPRSVVINDAPMLYRQGCALWAMVVGRRQGHIVEFDTRVRPGHEAVFLLSDCARPLPVPPGFVPDRELRLEPLCARSCSQTPSR